MKTNLSILAGAASLAALISGANAQTSAVTDPVGYITVNVNGGGTTAAPLFSEISPTLVNKVEFAGTVSAAAGNDIDVSGTPFTVGAYNQISPTKPAYWVEITNGATTEGKWANISATPANNRITTSTSLAASITPGVTTIKIRRHVTLGDFFGATNTAGLKGSDSAANADEVILFNGGAPANYFYSDFAGLEGWWDAGFSNPEADAPIQPNQGVLIARKAAAAVSFVFTGHVKTGKTQMGASNGFNILPVPLATGATLDASLLFTGADLTKSVDASDSAATADEVLILNAAGAPVSYFYSDFSGLEGWWDAGFSTPSGTTVLKEGTGFILNRKVGGPMTWTAPAQVIAP
jgi:uncharacterized protein (TIGR02597 family)